MTTNNLNNECLNDFVIGEGASGSTRKLRVENDNNTASSQAAIETYVGGTTSDDTFIRHVVGASHSYAHGIDNDDSQSFNIAYTSSGSATPASTKAIKATTDGELLYPNQPLFVATVTTGQSNCTGDGTIVKVSYNNEVVDQDSNFDTGNSRFTAPKDGVYFFAATIDVVDIDTTDHTYGGLWFKRNDTTILSSFNIDPSRLADDSNERCCGICTMIIDLEEDDYIEVYLQVGGHDKDVDIPSSVSGNKRKFFAGMLLG